MDIEDIIRRCQLMPKEGGYKRPEMEKICKQLNISTKDTLAELRKNVMASLGSYTQKTTGEDISDFSVEQLKERTKDKVLLNFPGCFCPPHAGHYNMISDTISKIRPDIVIIQSVNAANVNWSRHGTPLSHTIKTWKDWGKILMRKYGVDIYVTSINGIDNLIWGGGAEFIRAYIETSSWEGKEMPKEYKKTPLQPESLEKKSMGFLRNVPRDFKGFYKYNIQRDGDLSATSFVACLKDLEKECLMYAPGDLKDKESYIREIRENYYNTLT